MKQTPPPLTTPAADPYQTLVLENLKALLRGNAGKLDTLAFEKFEGQMLAVPARTTITTKVKTERVVRPGKVGGDVVHAQNLILPTLEVKMQQISAAPQTRADIIKAILARPDKGFQPTSDFSLNLNAYKTKVSAYDGCVRCHHTGRMTCVTCQGAREVTCPRCTGSRSIVCTVCNGSRQLHTPQGPKACMQCGATGRLSCPTCHQRARIPCGTCEAQGSLACEPCGGTGWTSVIMMGQLEGHGHFEMDEANAPQDVLAAIKSAGAKAVISDEWQIIPNTRGNPDGALHYTLNAPYATFNVTIGKMPITGTAFGVKGRIIQAPPFLEKIIQKPIKLLIDAATSKKDITAALAATGRYRLLREALLLGTKVGPAKTLAKLRNIYPVGIRAGTLAKITEATDILLRAGTEKARLQGVIAGVALASLFFGLVKFSGIEQMVVPADAQPIVHYIWLSFIGILGLFILRITIQLFGRFALRKLLAGLFRPEQLHGMMPQTGRTFYIGAAVCLLLFAMTEVIIP